MTERKLTPKDIEEMKIWWAPYSGIDYAVAAKDVPLLIHDLELERAEVEQLRQAYDILVSLTHWLEGFLDKEHICGESLRIGQEEVVERRDKAQAALEEPTP